MALRHGARQILTQIEADEDEALHHLDVAAARVKYNPDYAIGEIRKAQDAIRRGRARRVEELPPLLQKAAPPLEKRIAELERLVEELNRKIEGKVISLPDRDRKTS